MTCCLQLQATAGQFLHYLAHCPLLLLTRSPPPSLPSIILPLSPLPDLLQAFLAFVLAHLKSGSSSGCVRSLSSDMENLATWLRFIILLVLQHCNNLSAVLRLRCSTPRPSFCSCGPIASCLPSLAFSGGCYRRRISLSLAGRTGRGNQRTWQGIVKWLGRKDSRCCTICLSMLAWKTWHTFGRRLSNRRFAGRWGVW